MAMPIEAGTFRRAPQHRRAPRRWGRGVGPRALLGGRRRGRKVRRA